MPTNHSFDGNAKRLVLILWLTLLAGWPAGDITRLTSAAAQEKEMKNPLAGDLEAVKQGRSHFRQTCAVCHGLDARGGGRGPDLTSGRWVHGESDAALFRTITRGVPGTEMPASRRTDVEIWAIIAFLRSLGADASAPVAGDRQAGEQIFSGACSQCHMVHGRGGRLGPDLSRIGASRPTRHLIDSIRDPSKEIPAGYATVIAVTKDGTRITGVRKNEDSFSLQLMDLKEEIHLLLKKDLQEVIYERKSLMPEYTERRLKEKELQDLLAYLDSLRGK